MAISIIFFDLGDTLVQKAGLYSAISTLLSEFGIEKPAAELIRSHKLLREEMISPAKPSKEFYQSFNRSYLERIGVPPRADICDALFDRLRKLPWEIYNDVAVLKTLPQRLAIISNWDSSLEKVLEKVPVDFSFCAGSLAVGYEKPDMRLFQHALKETDTEPGQALHIGDSVLLDMEPALACGMKAALLDREDAFPEYDGIKMRSLDELPSVIKRLSAD